MRSVTLKLFALVASAFVLFLGAVLIFQSAFFENFYIKTKTDAFKASFTELAAKVDNSGMDNDELQNTLDGFARELNARATVFELAAERPRQQRNHGANTTIRINGLLGRQNISVRPAVETDRETLRSLTPVITDLPGMLGSAQGTAFRELEGIIIGVSRIRFNNADYLLFSSASMQPVGEAVSALRAYYVYICAGAVLTALCISLVVSRILARPLIAANDRLAADLKKEKRLDAMRKEFIAAASHELKTPIGLIGGYTEALRDGVAADESVKFLDVIAEETVKMGELVHEMLELVTLQDEGLRLDIADVDPDALVDGCVRRFTERLREKSVTVERQTAPGLELTADASKLMRALGNIIDNAIRHTPENGVISITTRAENGSVEIAVANQGRRIPDDELPLIWESFYRPERDGLSRQTGNYGLGLSIVRQIADVHGGKATAENTETGVVFKLLLPGGKRG